MLFKIHQSSSIFLIACLLFSINACTPNEPTPEPTPPAFESKNYETVDCAKDTAACKIISEQIAAYQTLIKYNSEAASGKKSVPDSVTVSGKSIARTLLNKELNTLRGYQFNLNEVNWIVDQAKDNGVDHVYTMFAINNSPTSVAHRQKIGSPITYLDLYFQVETPDAKSTFFRPVAGLQLDDYGDFPTPCPRTCPQ